MPKKKSSSPLQMSLFGIDQFDAPPDPAPKTTSAQVGAPITTATGANSDNTRVMEVADPTAGSTSDAATLLTTPAGKLVVVIDSMGVLYQVFHAMPEMSSPSGQPVGAVHGFLRDILDLLDKLQPDFLACAFDKGSITFRNEIYPEYKAHRDPMPDDLRPQIGYVQTLLQAMNIPILELNNYEADDIMATVAAQTEAAGGRCLLVTSDKDCRQLISSQVQIYHSRKAAIYNEKDLMVDWGIRPDQVVDFQTLVGDPTDNVPGVPLIGPKMAQQLLNQFENLDGVYANAESISGQKRKENLLNSRELVKMSRRLVELDRNTPIALDWSRLQVGGADLAQAVALCEGFGFRQLTARVRRLASSPVANNKIPRDQFQDSAVRETLEGQGVNTKSPEPIVNQSHVALDYRLIDSVGKLHELVGQLRRCRKISFDTETTSTQPRAARLVGLSFAWAPGAAAYIPILAPPGEAQLDWEATVRPALQPLFDDGEILKIGQNVKYDWSVLQNHGVTVQGTIFDTMVADYLLQPGRNTHGLEDLADRYLGLKATSIKELIGSGKNETTMDTVPLFKIVPYACQDADFAFRLEELLRAELIATKLDELFFQVEMPLVRVLAEMELRGIKIDSQQLAEFSQRLAERLEGLEEEIQRKAGRKINIDSPKQLAQLLFEELKLPVIKRTASGPSTDREVLEQLAERHELPALIIKYREAAKLKSTYADALPQMVLPQTGRVHTSFMQDVAATGRLSSKDPNLQNIPVRTEEGRQIRRAFIPGYPDWSLLMADYSQIELRMLAHFCRDENLCQSFHDQMDIHSSVAAEVFQVPIAEVSKDQRRRAKAINFGIIYGQSAFGLAKELDISREDASTFIEAYFGRYPRVLDFMEWTLKQARERGYVQTILGRRRPVEGVRPHSNYKSRNMPERIAINTVIQGSAADLIKLAMLRVAGSLRDSGLQAQLLLQIHDELVFETPVEEIDSLARLVSEEMNRAYQISVPLQVDVEVGKNWDQCQAWEE
ncbi:MAG: DNA polymerase I [Pirellulaceae bacterium]|nr:DNA polymerase I [Pirellulaceae bacterium]